MVNNIIRSTYKTKLVISRSCTIFRHFARMQAFYIVGMCVLSLLAYLVRGWRLLCFACAASCAAFLPTMLLVPESPRWLLSKVRACTHSFACMHACIMLVHGYACMVEREVAAAHDSSTFIRSSTQPGIELAPIASHLTCNRSQHFSGVTLLIVFQRLAHLYFPCLFI